MKKILSLVLVVAMLSALSVGMAFADNDPNPSVDINMTIQASSLDVTVDQSVNATVADGKVTVEDIDVTNNSTRGVVVIEDIKANAKNDWTLVASTTEFKTLPANAKQLSLVYNETTDFVEDTPITVNQDINPTETAKLKIAGETGIVTETVSEVNVAAIVLTLGIK